MEVLKIQLNIAKLRALLSCNIEKQKDTFLIISLLVGTIVTFNLYMLSNSVLSVAAVPVIPQSLGNCWLKLTGVRYSYEEVLNIDTGKAF